MGYFSSISIDIDNAKCYLRDRNYRIKRTPSVIDTQAQLSLWEMDEPVPTLTREEVYAVLTDNFHSNSWEEAIKKITPAINMASKEMVKK